MAKPFSKPGVLSGISVIKVLRATAFFLIITSFIVLLSGFLMVRMNIIDYSLLRSIHTFFVPMIFIPLLYLHSLSGVIIFLYRKGFSGNKKVKLAVGILWTLLFASFIFFYVSGAASNSTVTPISNITVAQGTVLSLSEISNHNSAASCWLIINGNVYDVTAYLSSHPPGELLITPFCGKDATVAFDTKGGNGQPHSSRADALLGNYLLGVVGSTVSGNITINAAVPAGIGDDEEGD
ncbi:MAG: cytochrome b5-like heme/steroid binding domain-containing protein [Candidatus Aenigmatarchaeota archaeon]